MERIQMTKKQLIKSQVIIKIVNKKITQTKASEELNIGLRQIKRLCKRYRKVGLEGLVH